MRNKKLYKIGLFGMEQSKIKFLKKKFKNIKFLSLNKRNLEKNYDLNSIIVFTEGSYKNWIDNFFLNRKYEYFKNLRWFHLSRAGTDKFNDVIKNLKFSVTSGKNIQAPNVSEHCIAILLYLSRRLNFSNNKKKLLMYRPIELYKKSVLVFGCGGVGQSIAQKLNSFGMEVSIAVRKKTKLPFRPKKFYKNQDLKKIVSKFDVLINAASLNKSTKNLFNKKIFSRMKKNSIFINISRGECVKTNDLLYYLRKGKFLGVGLDVIDKETLSKNHPIRKFPNFLYTSHTAGWSDTLHRRFKLIVDNITKFSNKGTLINLVKN
tara:strand:- start:398 stop:1354 length:957 start_codon:yes stop_codon:yes gene_type:complete